MCKVQNVTWANNVVVPKLIKLLVHGNTCDPKGNINPNPRTESVENLLPWCVVQWIAVQLACSLRWSGARRLVHHEKCEKWEGSKHRIFQLIKQLFLLRSVSLINYSLSHKNKIKVHHTNKSIDSVTILTIFKQAEENDRKSPDQP